MNELKTKFEEIFNSFAKFPKEPLEELYSSLTIVHIDKATDIVKQGESNTKDYYLLDGILREYAFDDDANEVTLNFYNKASIITPNFCRTNNRKSLLSIQTLSPSIIGIIEAKEFEKMRAENVFFAQSSALIITTLFKNKLQQQINYATQPGLIKLKQFRIDFPGLENYVPHSYIASYLGITNVSLSRLRKQK